MNKGLTRQYMLGLKIIILSGEQDKMRSIFALAYAYSAVLSGYKIDIFLSMDGACLADREVEDKVLIPKYLSIPKYLDALLEAGVEITVCTTCLSNYCKQHKKSKNIVRDGIMVRGFMSVIKDLDKYKIISF